MKKKKKKKEKEKNINVSSAEFTPLETICMKCQRLFLKKKERKKNRQI